VQAISPFLSRGGKSSLNASNQEKREGGTCLLILSNGETAKEGKDLHSTVRGKRKLCHHRGEEKLPGQLGQKKKRKVSFCEKRGKESLIPMSYAELHRDSHRKKVERVVFPGESL